MFIFMCSATSEFSSFAKDNAVFIESVLSGLFHTIQTKIITIVPQPDDYDCPVCYCTFIVFQKKKKKLTFYFFF